MFNYIKDKSIAAYKYTKDKKFSVSETPSEVGRFAEEIRKITNPRFRSFDPMFSFIDVNNSGMVNNKLITSSFSESSVFGKLYRLNSLNINVDLEEFISPQLHYFEKKYNVKYRKDRVFNGISENINGKIFKTRYMFFCKSKKSKILWNRSKIRSDLIKEKIVHEYNHQGINFRWFWSKDLGKFVKNKLSFNKNYLID